MLGTDAGTVHKQRQDSGLATIFGRSRAVDDFIVLDDREGAARAAAAAAEQAKAAKQQEARKKMLEFNPERWLKHEVEIRDMQEKWVDKGARLLNDGANPYTGTDPSAIEWRNSQARIEAYANASTQVQDYHKTVRNKMDGAEPDKYDPATIESLKNYFDTPVSKIVEEGILPPQLMERKPSANLQKSWVGLVTDLQTRTGKGEFTDGERWEFIQQSSANSPELVESAQSYFANLPQVTQNDYKARSQSTGRSVQDLIQYDFMTRYEKARGPFDLNKFVQTGADSIDVPYTQVRTPSGFGTYVDSKELARIAGQKAMIMLTSSPEALQSYESVLPMKAGENEGTYRQRAIADLSKRLRELKATTTVSGKTEKGVGEQEIADSGNRWLRDVKSPDKTVANEAAGYLFQTKGIFDLTVDKTMVLDHPLQSGPRNLVLTLKGKPTVKEVERALAELGLPQEYEYKTVGAEDQLLIPITNETENRLLKLHDKSFKETKVGYKGPITDWNAGNILQGNNQIKF